MQRDYPIDMKLHGPDGLVGSLGPAWKKRLLATREALLDGEKALVAAGLDAEALEETVRVIDELVKMRGGNA
jgi:hypothetical protein